LDVSEQGGEPGLVIINANTPPRPFVPARQADPSGPVAARLLEVLERQVNPQIAMHGGHAALVAVEGSVAYVEMSGGCQGCGMARATLSQGIAIAITDAVPEITEVVDVTDHMSGTNPYYEPAPR
jgi:Fe/S biogenesis protein NfuA